MIDDRSNPQVSALVGIRGVRDEVLDAFETLQRLFGLLVFDLALAIAVLAHGCKLIRYASNNRCLGLRHVMINRSIKRSID